MNGGCVTWFSANEIEKPDLATCCSDRSGVASCVSIRAPIEQSVGANLRSYNMLEVPFTQSGHFPDSSHWSPLDLNWKCI